VDLVNANEVDISSEPLGSYDDGENMEEEKEEEDGEHECQEIEEEEFKLGGHKRKKARTLVVKMLDLHNSWSSCSFLCQI
jgi:hypothetical protein